MFEHRVYLASWGIFAGPAAWLVSLVDGRGARARAIAAGALVALWGALAVATHGRNAVWESKEAFARDGLEKSPGKARVYVTMGHALREKGRHDEAIRSYEAGLERARAANDARMEMQLLRNLGAAHEHSGRAAEAAAAFRAALERGEHPDLPPAGRRPRPGPAALPGEPRAGARGRGPPRRGLRGLAEGALVADRSRARRPRGGAREGVPLRGLLHGLAGRRHALRAHGRPPPHASAPDPTPGARGCR